MTCCKALLSQQLSRMDAYKEAQRILARELPVLLLASPLRVAGLSLWRDMKVWCFSPSVTLPSLAYRGRKRRGENHDYFTLRRLLLLLVTSFSDLCRFQPELLHPHARWGATLWNAWLFWFEGYYMGDFGVSSINGQLISEQLRGVPGDHGAVHPRPSALPC